MMLDTLIKNAVVIPMTGEGEYMKNASVGIKDGKIAYLGHDAPDAARVIDAGGDIVMPGLINAHAHTAMCVMRGYADDYALQDWLYKKVFPVEARLDEEAIVAGAVLGMAEMIASGTVSFSDMYFCQPAVAKEVERIGMKANLCNAVLALSEDYDPEKDRAVIETRKLIAEYGVKGRIRADVAIHAEYTSPPEIWKLVHEWAKDAGAITQIHISETKTEHEGSYSRHGLSPAAAFDKYGILSTPALMAHGVWLEESDMELLAKRGASIAHCPVSNLKLGSGMADIAAMRRAGVNVCLGTDGVCSNNSLDLFEEIKLSALLSKGEALDPTATPAYEALKMATVNGAKAQGREGETGMIALEYDADIIMIDTHAPHMRPMYDPISAVVYSAHGSDVKMTMVEGRILYMDGEFMTMDVQDAIRRVEEHAVPIVLA